MAILSDQQRASLIADRLRDLMKLFRARYGVLVPATTRGLADVRLALDHAMLIGYGEADDLLLRLMPMLDAAERDALLDEVGRGFLWSADGLGEALKLDEATRFRLRLQCIGAIDCGTAQRKRRRKRDSERRRKARRAADRIAISGKEQHT